MRRIAVIGAGQAGLQLALGLRPDGTPGGNGTPGPDGPPEGNGAPGDNGTPGGPADHPPEPYDVTLYAARTPEEVRRGPVSSTQVMYGPALALERAAGLQLWEARAPRIASLGFAVADPQHSPAGGFGALLDEPAQSVDLRVKTAGWLELFEARGGRVAYGTVGPADLPGIAAAHDLTVVATGHGPLAEVFARDARHSPYDRPQRTLAVCYVRGTRMPDGFGGPHVRVTPVGGLGEFFVMHGLTLDGPCEIVLWEAVPGGPLDVWADRPGPAEVVERTLELLRGHLPGEYELCRGMEPTDAGAALTGALTPVVRRPVAEVAPGAYVLGLGDAVVLNDPISGQGSNSAARGAGHYLKAITGHGDEPFDRTWMLRTFAGHWEHARHVTAFTNMLLGPPPEHVQRILAAAARHPDVAHRYANGFADPAGFREWFTDADRADAYLAAVGAAGATVPADGGAAVPADGG
ncbi:styrene monooxygenase/indole monooxygenase family protein [Streptomyces hiroshimensis]|uniref:Alanine-phosphoribitol ligase n=1 Tax=Streptomyces hiroshimensis TaxID=66424 RepID=A0ABQ2Y8K9_9ACTN|nr:styrene monooxygenase/indole monooxygenase family protein [Streptomyces hiroshimensis]GGX69804.1 alanine-phosphoribitol ligase [Streptomyces hiroshimensis]